MLVNLLYLFIYLSQLIILTLDYQTQLILNQLLMQELLKLQQYNNGLINSMQFNH